MRKRNKFSELELSITIETKDNTIEIPITQKNKFELGEAGIVLNDTFHFWEDIIAVMIVNKTIGKVKGGMEQMENDVIIKKEGEKFTLSKSGVSIIVYKMYPKTADECVKFKILEIDENKLFSSEHDSSVILAYAELLKNASRL